MERTWEPVSSFDRDDILDFWGMQDKSETQHLRHSSKRKCLYCCFNTTVADTKPKEHVAAFIFDESNELDTNRFETNLCDVTV